MPLLQRGAVCFLTLLHQSWAPHYLPYAPPPPNTPHLHLLHKGLGAVGVRGLRGGTNKAQGLGQEVQQGLPVDRSRVVPQSPVNQPLLQVPPATQEALLEQKGGKGEGDGWSAVE